MRDDRLILGLRQLRPPFNSRQRSSGVPTGHFPGVTFTPEPVIRTARIWKPAWHNWKEVLLPRPFLSGSGASMALLQALQPGDHVIAPVDAYYGTTALLREIFARWGFGGFVFTRHRAP